MNRIIYDHQTFALQQFGGISRYFCELASRVHAAPGFDAAVVAPLHFNDYLASCKVPKVGLYVPLRHHTHRIYRVANSLLSPVITRVMSPALIHRTYFQPSAPPTKAPVVVTVYDMIHELFADTFPPRDHTSHDKRASLARADHIICISESTASDLVRLFNIPREKITVTYLGYSSIFSTTSLPDEAAPYARPYILYVGHRASYKNFVTALRAYASSQALRDNFDLVVFGGPPIAPAEREQISALGLRPSQVVRLGGSDAELARAYRHARAFMYPSLYEGFGIPPLEAMASGCPVICSNVSSIPEVVGNAAAIFDPTDVDAARAALETTCFDEEVRRALLAAGSERVRQFSWDRCAAETMAAYQRVLGSRA